MKKVKIFTLVDQRPDFIELQYKSLKKYIKDDDWEYIVLNNAIRSYDKVRKGTPPEVGERNKLIENICESLDIQNIQIELEGKFQVTNGNTNFQHQTYIDGVTATSYALNWAWDKYLSEIYDDCIVIIIDSDMFLINDINFNTLMDGYNIAFIPQYRGSNQEVFYPWNGIVVAKPNEIINAKEVDWDLGTILGHKTDIGGYSHHYLEKYKDQLSILYLEFWNIGDIYESGDNKIFAMMHLNGNARFDYILNNNTCVKFEKENKKELYPHKIFGYEVDKENYQQYIINNFLEVENFLFSRGARFPHPVWVDLIKSQNQEIRESFIFHYKSGSNYQPFATPEYNEKKTQELIKLLGV